MPQSEKLFQNKRSLSQGRSVAIYKIILYNINIKGKKRGICALDGGASLDDITDALNVFNKQNQVRKARQQALDEIECDFLNEHIGQLAVLIYAPSHPEWLSLKLPELSG